MESPRVTSEEISIWLTQRIAAILECPEAEVDPDVHFTSLGLDSLSLLTLTGDLANWLGRNLAAPLLLGYPTIESLSQHLSVQVDSAESAAIPRAPRGEPLPLTFSQARILRYSKMGPEGDGNLVGRRFVFKGSLDVDALRWAFSELTRRHEILRTTFAFEGGEGVQIVHPPQPFHPMVIDLSDEPQAESRALEILKAEGSNVKMDLQKGPLIKVILIKVSRDEYRFILLVHHMVCDAEGLTILSEEVGALYTACISGAESPLSELPVQVADVGAWQRQWLRKDGPAYQERLSWWMRHWDGNIPAPLELPFRREQTPAVPPQPTECEFDLPISSEVTAQLKELAHGEGATSYMAFLAVFTLTLYRLTGEDDLVVGTYVSDRTRSDTQRLMGVFVNMLPIRMRLAGLMTFRELLHRTRDVVDEATRHRELPIEDLYQGLLAAGKSVPEVRVIFQLVSDTKHVLDLPGVNTTRWKIRPLKMHWGFHMNLVTKKEFGAHVSCDGNLYDPAGAKAFLRQYLELLHGVVGNLDLPVQIGQMEPAAA